MTTETCLTVAGTPAFHRELLVEAVQSATREVFALMLGFEIGPGEISIGTKVPQRVLQGESKVTALLGLTGMWEGSGQISCEPAFACKLASTMLLAGYDSVDDDVLDVIAEIANIIVGNVKNILARTLGPMGLSTPTVIFGGEFETRTAGSPDWVTARFRAPEGELLVRVFLAPSRTSRTPGLQLQRD